MTTKSFFRQHTLLLAGVSPLLASLLLLGVLGGCSKKTGDDATGDGGMVAATADSDDTAAASPPPSVVDGDPNVPVNEAVVGTPPLPADYAADTAPPPPVDEDRPPMPQPDETWVPGYWWWSAPLHRYVWVGGAWRVPPADHVWTAGGWVAEGPRWYWRAGFWGARGWVPGAPAGVVPPPLRAEVRGPMPGAGYAWTPGYWAWHTAYDWTPGAWARAPHEGWGWVEPRWVGVAGHYYFQPGRWDWPVAARGTVYRPDPDVRPGGRYHPVEVPRAVVYAHAAYVAAAARAVAHGAVPTRTPGGGWAVHTSAEVHTPEGHPTPAHPTPEHPTEPPKPAADDHPAPGTDHGDKGDKTDKDKTDKDKTDNKSDGKGSDDKDKDKSHTPPGHSSAPPAHSPPPAHSAHK